MAEYLTGCSRNDQPDVVTVLRLTNGGLTRFATYFDIDSRSARYITPETVAAVVGKDADMFVLEAGE